MSDPRRLHDRRSGLEPYAPDAVVLELDPAAQHVDELEIERVVMALAGDLGCAAGADDVRADAPAGRRGDAEIAVREERAQPGVPVGIARMADRKSRGRRLRVHRALRPSQRTRLLT